MKLFLMSTVNQRDPAWVYAVVLCGVALVSFLVWLLNRLYPPKKSFRGSVGNALVRMEASFLPGRDHVAEAAEHEYVDEDDEGDPPRR